MIIKFSNLGAIKETELDLRPLTVIIGPNNSNKTYIAYSVYGLFKQYHQGYYFGYLDLLADRVKPDRENIHSLKLDEDIVTNLIRTYTGLVVNFEKELEAFFQDSSGQLFAHTKFVIELLPAEISLALSRIEKLYVAGLYNVKISLQEDILKLNFNAYKSERESFVDPQYVLVDLLHHLRNAIQQILFASPFLLPVERTAFILTYKALANRRYKLLKEARRGLFGNQETQRRQVELLKEQGDISYPQPVEDFLDFLTDIEFQSEVVKDRNDEFFTLATIIEECVQSSNETNLTLTKFGGKEIKVSIKKELEIDLYNASSSIKQLASLLLYLRYRAKKNDLLIIDEPETGLHPEAQVKLLEALAILVNLGVKVLLTTHSPYLMAHLNNLISGEVDKPAVLKKQATQLYLKDTRAFLRDEQVSAYEMRDNKLVSLKDPDYGIRWDTLSDVSVDIQQKFFKLSEIRESGSNGKKK